MQIQQKSPEARVSILSDSFSFIFEAFSHGPVYAAAMSRIRNPQPLDADRNWDYWTKPRNRILTEALKHYPPAFLRKSMVNRRLRRAHEVGIAAHYDVSNEFYRLFLDKKYMFYSCADFRNSAETLEQAQQHKADFILNLINPKAGEKILELGCGWGAMLRRIFEATGDRENLYGYTLSKEQIDYNKERNGFNVSFTNFITNTYAEESFDKIYSIGAWEHVRPNEIPALLQKLYRALKPGGKLIQHFFCLPGEDFPVAMLVAQIFFPGSVLSSYQFQIQAFDDAGFKVTHESTHDYRPTLKTWYDNLSANRDKAIDLVGVETYNRYMVFFPISWRVFDEGQAKVYRFVLEK
jgi:cyclopropane-fatty-acyl-phospholipid synthase